MRYSVAGYSFLAAFITLSLAEPVHADTCGCVDLADLKARKKEAEVAANTYQAEMQNMQDQMMRELKPLYYTAARREKLQGKVRDALNQNAAGKLTTAATGNTDNLCNISVNERATACMQESVRQHEGVHRAACLKTLGASSVAGSVSDPSSFKDRFERDNVPLMKYAAEEFQGYWTEMMFLTKEIASLEKTCKPKAPEIQRDYTSVQRDYTSQPRAPNPALGSKPPEKRNDPVNQLRGLFRK